MPRNIERLVASHGSRLSLCLALAWGTLAAGPAQADVLHLDGGRQLVGRIVSRDADAVTIRAYGGDVRVLRSEIVRIEGDEPPVDIESLVRTHRRSLRPGDVTGALRLADLAREHSLTEEEGELLLLAVAWKPQSDDLRSRLGAWRRTSRRLPASTTAVAHLKREFGGPCEVYRTRRFVVAHDCSPAAAERAGDALERTWSRLHDLADLLALELSAPETALPVHVRAGHTHWSGFLEVVGELFEADDRLRPGPAPVVARDGSRHVEECESVAALRAVEEHLARRRAALERGVEELREVREMVQGARADGEALWVTRTRRASDVARRVLDEERRARTALATALPGARRLLGELPRVHARTDPAEVPLLAGSAWRALQHESVAGERLASRLERLESSVLARFDEGRALGPAELDDLERRLTAILDLAVPQRLLLRDRVKAAADLRAAVTTSLLDGDRVALTRAAARRLSVATGFVGDDAPTWVAEGLSGLVETADGESDALDRGAEAGGRVLAAAWAPTEAAGADAGVNGDLAALLDGDAFRREFARARRDAVYLFRLLVERRPVETGRYLTELRSGSVAGDDPVAFERFFGPVGELLPALPTRD